MKFVLRLLHGSGVVAEGGKQGEQLPPPLNFGQLEN